jgi:hypothetical protein
MRSRLMTITASAGLALCTVMDAFCSVAVVENGAVKADVILAPDAADGEKAAAYELVTYVRRVTGAELPLRHRRTPGRAALLVGLSAAPEPIRGRVRALRGDGFVLEAKGDTLVLAGNGRDGTSFAVYEFLERFAGVRWLWPGAVGEVVPRRTTLLVDEMSLAREPAFVWRFLGPGGALWGPYDRWGKERMMGISAEHQGAQSLWEKRNRFGGENIYGGHAFGEILPPSVYGPTHPEYFALVKGERQWKKFDGKHACQPCTSNPEVVQKTIEYCTRKFATQPELDGVSIGLNDGRGFCECDNCMKLDTGRMQTEAADPELGRGGQTRIITDRVITFCNQVAEGVARLFPQKKLLFFGYSQFHSPPERVKVHPNVVMAYTVNASGFWNEGVRAKAFAELAGWARMAPTLGVYEYHTQTNFPDMPRLIPELIQVELGELQRLGARYFHTQAGNGFATNGLNFYVLGRLLWDPSADVKGIQADYVQSAFGPAAEPMHRYYNRLIASWRDKKSDAVRMNSFSAGDYQAVLGTYPRELREACERDLEEALRAAQGEHRRRVEFVRDGFRYLELTMAATETTFPLLQAGWRPADGANRGKFDAVQLERALDAWRDRERFIEQHREDFVLSYMWVKSGDETRGFNPLRRVRLGDSAAVDRAP